ncbi:TolC family protein [Alienimonas californiensis]|uniref:Outer membrane efflux protein n=1 Tax=Alienimonas californiensis TaxID=2527989 RepID=A0A517PB38_9PLAN|nr:TolC family protein [Alienimonas californiensis]QDT16595.1 Outer membrane efflux protein [Alienimonas californiensis]
MQDQFLRRPSLALAASLPLAGLVSLAGGCAADGDCCRQTATRPVLAAEPALADHSRVASSAIHFASHQDGVGDSVEGSFFDPLLDAPQTDGKSSPGDRRTPGNGEAGDEFADPLLDAPAGDRPASDGTAEALSGGSSFLTEDAPAIELAEAVALAVARSPRTQAARNRAAATAARVPQVTALDDPMVMSTSYPIHDQSLQTAGGRIQTGVQVTQRIPWLEKLGARGEVVRREAQAASTEAATAELDAAFAARTAWFEAWFADRAIEVTLRNRELLEQLLDVAVARVRTGGGQTDVLRTQLEIDRLDDRVLTLRQQRDVARADLAATLRLPPGAALPTAAEELPPLNAAAEVDALFAAAQRCRPELQRIGWEIARDRAQRRVACLAGKPDFTAGLGYTVVTEEDALAGMANGHDNVSVLFGLTLPIYRDKIRAGVAEADRRIAADSRALDAEQDDTLRQIRRLGFRLETLAEQLVLLEDRILPRAEQTLDVSLADYRGERIGFTEVSNSYGDLLRLEVQQARLRADVGVALAELERAVGCDLASMTPEPAIPPTPVAPPPAPLPGTLQAPPPIPAGEEPGDAAAEPAAARDETDEAPSSDEAAATADPRVRPAAFDRRRESSSAGAPGWGGWRKTPAAP